MEYTAIYSNIHGIGIFTSESEYNVTFVMWYGRMYEYSLCVAGNLFRLFFIIAIV